MGQLGLKFAPASDDSDGARYNPLCEVRLRTSNEIRDVRNIVQMIIDPDGRGSTRQNQKLCASSSDPQHDAAKAVEPEIVQVDSLGRTDQNSPTLTISGKLARRIGS